ncbi:MAG: IS1634 family transposase [Pseudomonadota bacterium]
MYIRKTTIHKDGKAHHYWALVESYRTERGPRQRVVAWLGEMDKAGRLGVEHAAEGTAAFQQHLFEETEPEWVEVDVKRVRIEHVVDFGGPWLGLELTHCLGLDQFFQEHVPGGREEISWAVMADLLGIPSDKINEDRLYRALDQVLPYKEALEQHLKERAGSLFKLDYDLFLYDVTSTYFEGEARNNPLAQRGYSRDHRGDCKQICIGLVVSREGFPLGYELFAGNRTDVTTVEEMIDLMEGRYGRVNRIGVMDRGMVSEETMGLLTREGRRYILGTQRGQLKKYEGELLKADWQEVQYGLEVKRVDSPDGKEVFILCRSRDRAEKEKAIHDRFEQRIEETLVQMAQSCEKRRYQVGVIERRIGRLLERNSRAAGFFDVRVEKGLTGGARVVWIKKEDWREWSRLSEGCYMLRSNIRDWSPEELWRAYIQLTEAEEAFRIHKSDLSVRPIWHQKEGRGRAHILVCFLAYVLWKTLGRFCRQAGLGDEPRKVFQELSQIKLTDVILPTRNGKEIILRFVETPSRHQGILLQHLKLNLPKRFMKRSS